MNVVFLCIGAAKAGTDWLHRQLSAHPDCHMRSIKELHWFDALEGRRIGRELEKHRGEHEALLTRLASTGQVPDADQARRLADRAAWMDVLERGGADPTGYLDYLGHGARNGQVVGDLTPAYALLPERRLREMATMARDVRVLFLMRDPVDRLWSHVRMIAARRDPDGKVSHQRCARILDRTIAGEEDQIARRSDYAGTLKRLAAAVPGGRWLSEVFEEMVAGEGLLRICAFLGIAPMAADPVPVHRGQPLEITRQQRRAAARWLAPQYETAERVLGRMPGAWRAEG